MNILVVTNRELKTKYSDHRLFGEKINDKGASEIRLALAEKNGAKWELDLVKEPKRVNPDNPPSHKAIPNYISELNEMGKNCIFYVHGFNKDFKETLNQANSLVKRYDVGVILFSWPSNPGGWIVSEYKKARAIASNSIVALDRSLDKLNQSTNELPGRKQIKIASLFHSLGNYIFEEFIRNPIFTGETRIFDNNILNASDVDNDYHSDWTNSLIYAPHTFATINEKDWILGASDIINPDRLGNTARNLNSDRVTYINLTGGNSIRTKHQHFESSAKKNKFVENLFDEIINSNSSVGLDGFTYKTNINAYELID